MGLWLSLTSITLFALVDPFLNADVLGTLYVFKAFHDRGRRSACSACCDGLRRAARWSTAALLAVAVFSVMTAVSGIVTDDPATTPVLLIVLSMGTATLLPWGVRPQLAVQAIVAEQHGLEPVCDRGRVAALVAAAGAARGFVRLRVRGARRGALPARAPAREAAEASCARVSTRRVSRTRRG